MEPGAGPSRWSSGSSLGSGARAPHLMCRMSGIEAAFEACRCCMERNALLRVKACPIRCQAEPPVCGRVCCSTPSCISVAGSQPLIPTAGDSGLSPAALSAGSSEGSFWILAPLPAEVDLECFWGEHQSRTLGASVLTASLFFQIVAVLCRASANSLPLKKSVPNYLSETFIKELLKTPEVYKEEN